MPMKEFRVVQFSTKFSAKLPLFETALDVIIGHTKPKILFLTEMNDNHRISLIKRGHVYPNYDSSAYKSNAKGECAIMWENDMTCLEHGSHIMSHTPFYTRKGGKRKPINFQWAALKYDDKFFICYAGHPPAGVGDRHSLRGRHGKVYREVARSFRHHSRQMRRKYPHSKVILGIDSNRNMKRSWVRVAAKRFWGLKSAWTAKSLHHLGHRGSHGKRVIDDIRSSGFRSRHTHLLGKFAGFDHRAIETRIRYWS